MNCFKMWDSKIVFKNGWYLYLDGKGNNSVISPQCAREIEINHYRYMADMDTSRGGIEPDYAFKGRGFDLIDGQYVYLKPLTVESLSKGQEVYSINNKLVIPSKVGEININYVHRNAFTDIHILEEVFVPETVTAIGINAFSGCSNLKIMNLPRTPLTIEKDVFKDTFLEKSFNGSAFYIGKHLIQANKNISGEYNIANGTLSIAANAFDQFINLKSITIPNSVSTIGYGAFSGCIKLEKVDMPESLELLGDSSFYNCHLLKKIIVPENVKSLGKSTFENCTSLEDIQLPKSLTSVGFSFIKNTKILNQFRADKSNVLYIGKWLIEYKAQYEGDLIIKSGTIGIADQNLLSYNFKKRCIRSIKFPKSLKYIGMSAFEKCNALEEISLPKGLLELRVSSFRDCISVKKIIVPESVSLIDTWSFMGCENLSEISVLGRSTIITAPAITGRKDKKTVSIIGLKGSTAEEYCNKYGEQYSLQFKKHKRKFLSFIKA